MKILLFSYSIFLLIIVLFSFLFVDVNISYLNFLYTGFATSNRGAISFLYVGIIIFLFIFYFIFLINASKGILTFHYLKITIAVQTTILIFSYPTFLSYDIFNYIFTSKVLFLYQENPYLVMPIELLGDPNLAFTHAANKIALYGPFWILLTFFPHFFSFGNFFLALINFKLLVALFYLLTVFFVWRFTKNIHALCFFALNPLIVIETLASGHNDVVMMSLALGSLYYLFNRKNSISIILFIFSVLIKYATIFLLPSFFYVVHKKFMKKKINARFIFIISTALMIIVFLLSPLREEIYPWYAIWILTFVSLIFYHRFISIVAHAFTFGLMMRYVPFMLLGSHFGITPMLKILVTFCLPLLLIIFFWLIQKKWKKNILV